MLPVFGGLFLGWSLGANDAANVFGTAVASRIITLRKASILCGLAVILGAIVQGQKGIVTYSELSNQNIMTLLIASVSAAVTVTIMTLKKLPISTSQAIVGAIAGIGLTTGTINWAGFQKVVICWFATPIGAMLISFVIYKLLSLFIRYIPMGILTRDKILWGGLLILGTYGSYALGANNVANATGIFSGHFPAVSDRTLALLGGIAIAFGVITYSKPVMMAVGSGIIPLDAFTAFVSVFSMAVTVHFFAFVGVPVSTSQAIVGAILGICIIRRSSGIQLKALRNIGIGWLLTPIISLILSAAGYAIFVIR